MSDTRKYPYSLEHAQAEAEHIQDLAGTNPSKADIEQVHQALDDWRQEVKAKLSEELKVLTNDPGIMVIDYANADQTEATEEQWIDFLIDVHTSISEDVKAYLSSEKMLKIVRQKNVDNTQDIMFFVKLVY